MRDGMTMLDAETIRDIREIDGTGEVLRNIVGLFARDSPGALSDAAVAAGIGDADAFRRAVHGLKGSAATVGAVRFAEFAARLERLAGEGVLPATVELELLSTILDQTLDEMLASILADD